MKLYLEMLKRPVFTLEDVAKVYNSVAVGKNALIKLKKDGYIVQIRKNLYTCISPETGVPIANKYQIASAITDTSFISHYTALEYYGVADQVYYDVYVESKSRFKEFEYDGYTYRCVVTSVLEGVCEPPMTKGIYISDMERTVIDSIKNIDKIAGVEAVLSSIEILPHLSEKRLLKYLEYFDNQFLYQKTGFILQHYGAQVGLSQAFFEACKRAMGQSKRYFTKDSKCTVWDKTWKMMVPDGLFIMKNGVYK